MSQPVNLPRFFGLVLLLLIPAFALWMYVGPWLAGPAVWFCDVVLTSWMPELVVSVKLQGTQALVLTHFGDVDGKLVPAREAGYQLGFPVDLRLVSYSIPLYGALHFARRQEDSATRFTQGFLILYPVAVCGLLCLCVKNLFIGLGGAFYTQGVGWLPPGDIIAILYQLNSLIIPPLAPILVWVWQSRESDLFKSFSGLVNAE